MFEELGGDVSFFSKSNRAWNTIAYVFGAGLMASGNDMLYGFRASKFWLEANLKQHAIINVYKKGFSFIVIV